MGEENSGGEMKLNVFKSPWTHIVGMEIGVSTMEIRVKIAPTKLK